MMARARRGEVWLVRFPFSDLTSTKVRPSLVIAGHGEDIIVLGIFSRIPASGIRPTWVEIADRDPEFGQTGLKKTSLIRAEKIAVIHESVLQRQLGTLPAEILARVQNALKSVLFLA